MALSATQLFNGKIGRALGRATLYTLMASNLAATVIAIDSEFGNHKAPTPAFRALEKCLSPKSLHRTPTTWAGAAVALAPGFYAGKGLVEFSKIYGQTITSMGPLPLMQHPH